MNERVLKKADLERFLQSLRVAHRVYVPVDSDDQINLALLGDGQQLTMEFANTTRPPKEVFFPRSETLFTYENGEVSNVPTVDEPTVVFGIRPCDAQSFGLLDAVFESPDYQDPYYAIRRQNTTLVGLGCNDPASTCFCTSVGGAPFSGEGLDVLLADLGDRYLVEPLTERGEALVADGEVLIGADDEDLRRKEEIASRAEAAVTGPSIEDVKTKLDGMYDSSFWNQVQMKCLGCGICTYVCPTCHCFDVVDETLGDRGCRIRNWDSCQFALFTLHASGHNPRPAGKERMRQRIMHKFRYFVENFDETACVGCGRCVRQCPVNLDIRSVLEALASS